MKKEVKQAEIESKIVNCVLQFARDSEANQLEWREKANTIYRLINAETVEVNEEGEEVRPLHLNRVQVAHERLSAEYARGLVDFDKWMKVSKAKIAVENPVLTEFEANRLLQTMLGFSDPKIALIDAVRNGLAENLICLKVESYKKRVGNKDVTHFRWVPKSIEQMLLDPRIDSNLYTMEVGEQEKFELLDNDAFSKKKEQILALSSYQIANHARKKNSDGDTQAFESTYRCPIKVIEFWGTVLDSDGTILKWVDGKELRNVQLFIANDTLLLCDPIFNKRFSGRSPYVISKLLRSSRSKFGNALLYHGAELNEYQNKLAQNLIDAGLKEGHNITAVFEEFVKNKEILDGALDYNKTIVINGDVPPGTKVFQTEKLGQVSSGMLSVFNIVDNIMGQAMLANDQYFSGTPQASVSATGQLQAQNVVNGLFDHHGANIDDTIVEEITLETFHDILRKKDEIPDEYLRYVFSDRPEQIATFKATSVSDIMNQLGYAFRFQGKGKRSIAAAKAKAQAVVQLSSVIFGNQMLTDELLKSGFSIKAILAEIFKSVDFDPEDLVLSQLEQAILERRLLVQEEALTMMQMTGDQQEQIGGAANPIQQAPSDFPVGQQEGQQF